MSRVLWLGNILPHFCRKLFFYTLGSLNPWHRIWLMEYISVSILLYRRSRPELVVTLFVWTYCFIYVVKAPQSMTWGYFVIGHSTSEKALKLDQRFSTFDSPPPPLGLVYIAANNSSQSSYFNHICGSWPLSYTYSIHIMLSIRSPFVFLLLNT